MNQDLFEWGEEWVGRGGELVGWLTVKKNVVSPKMFVHFS